MWGAKTVHTVVARASIGAAVLLATLLTLLPSRVRRKWFERLGSLGRSVDNLLNSTVLFGIDPLADLSALEAGLLPQTADVDERVQKTGSSSGFLPLIGRLRLIRKAPRESINPTASGGT